MISHSGAWLPSVILALPIIILAVLALTLLTVGLFRYVEDGYIFGWMTGPVTVAIVILALVSYWPYHGDYHRLQPATGVVKSVDSRFFAASQYVVVTYDTGLTVRCDDIRCATVRPGDTLKLLCTKEHQFGSPLAADGWGCRWGEQ